jgi:hypothetical protein
MKKLFLFSLLFFSLNLTAQDSTLAKNEILLVYFRWFPAEPASIYFFYGGDNTVIQPLPERTKEDDRETPYFIYMKSVMANTFSSLYAQGWKLLPDMEPGTSIYYLERPINNP